MTLSPCPEQTSDLFRAIETSSLRSTASLFRSNLENVWKIHITLMNYNFFFSNSVILVSRFFLFLSLDPSNFNGNARLWNININYISIQYLKRKTQTAYLLDLWWIYDIPRQPLRITTRNSNITRVMIFYSYLTCLLHEFCVVVFHLIYYYPIEFKFGVNGRG